MIWALVWEPELPHWRQAGKVSAPVPPAHQTSASPALHSWPSLGVSAGPGIIRVVLGQAIITTIETYNFSTIYQVSKQANTVLMNNWTCGGSCIYFKVNLRLTNSSLRRERAATARDLRYLMLPSSGWVVLSSTQICYKFNLQYDHYVATVMGLSAPHVRGYKKLTLIIILEHILYCTVLYFNKWGL